MKVVPTVLVATLALAALVLGAAMAPVRTAPSPGRGMAGEDAAASVASVASVATRAATPPATGTPALAEPPAGGQELALTDDQRLIADHALRQAMDAYLQDRRNPRRLQQLDDHLRARLPAGAAAEARALAARYDAYLAEHDALLAAQNFTADPDLYRLASWQAQRRQLRERALGAQVSDQWFGTEDAYLEQALEERRQTAGASAPAQSTASSEDERLHARHMRQVIDAAIGRTPPWP